MENQESFHEKGSLRIESSMKPNILPWTVQKRSSIKPAKRGHWFGPHLSRFRSPGDNSVLKTTGYLVLFIAHNKICSSYLKDLSSRVNPCTYAFLKKHNLFSCISYFSTCVLHYSIRGIIN